VIGRAGKYGDECSGRAEKGFARYCGLSVYYVSILIIMLLIDEDWY